MLSVYEAGRLQGCGIQAPQKAPATGCPQTAPEASVLLLSPILFYELLDRPVQLVDGGLVPALDGVGDAVLQVVL